MAKYTTLCYSFRMEEQVILVDENDTPVGEMEKMAAHEQGLLHRAFSVFIFNKRDEMLLQKRAASKYHSGELWTNTCCSHPRPGENVMDAAHRKLMQEMGFDCELKEIFHFTYRAELDKGLIEHEFDHVLFGTYENDPILNPEEAEDFAWVSMQQLANDIKQNPESYTVWFRICFEKVSSLSTSSF